MKYIDLTMQLNEQTATYPGDPPVKIIRQASIEQDGWTQHDMQLSTHIGTHIDAPLHMISGGKSLDMYTVDKFIGPAITIDAQSGFNVSKIINTPVVPDSIVLFHTGWDKQSREVSYYKNYEQIPEVVVEWLIDSQVKLIGLDMSGPDYDPFPVHKMLLRNDILIIECMTNLDRLPSQGFRVIALPLRMNLDGAQVRVIAEIAD